MFALSPAGPQPVPTAGHGHVVAHGSPFPQKPPSSPGEDYKFPTAWILYTCAHYFSNYLLL